MATGRTASVLRHLRVLFAAGTTAGLTDSELLERFTAKRAESAEAGLASEAAFSALMDRHGAMVWGVCRRVLGDTHEAEDAFQATFLVLVRKAGSVRVDDSVGRWLYGVAHRVALRARSEARRRESRPGHAPAQDSEDPATVVELKESCHALSEEIDRLPAKYRCPIELCDLQGLTYDQAARQLNGSVAMVKGRLVRGRLKLRERLAERGLSPVAAVGFQALSREARLAVPPKLVHSTVRAVTSYAPGLFPAAVIAQTEEVLKMMMWEKLKLAAAGALVAAGLTAGALAQQQPASQDRAPEAPRPKVNAQSLEKPNRKPGEDRRWLKTMSSGATLEVVAISPHPSGPNTWWRPNGTPLSQPPCDPFPTRLTSDENVVPRAIVVRLTGIPAEADHRWWIDQANGGSHSQGDAKLAGIPVSGLSEIVTFFPSGLDSSTIRFEVAAGPWKTVRTWGKSPGAVGSREVSYIFSAPIATKKGTTLSVTHNIQDVSVRLVAVDGEGKEHPAENRSGSGVGDYYQITGEFNLPPDQIEEFRVQTRPYEKGEINGVALKPSGPA
ncbi:RNA polymerase sigma factor, sigma-70 family [Singulisphaera sp. GP187]|uniref:RNA polymerase sigma factor n=1 Tax=Singulisphaera sp. GP187 TaxID=1882752 RepID=UPI000926F1D7|nr:RNA polymerase sigma factor [Singulisphaera sp. GP187]SIO56007.1 RNA polymerase sigma factor, sigma-70 family [Singulisphaera sp. GP187]